MKRLLLILVLMAATPAHAQQQQLSVAYVQQQISSYYVAIENSFSEYEQQAIQLINNIKAYITQKMQAILG